MVPNWTRVEKPIHHSRTLPDVDCRRKGIFQCHLSGTPSFKKPTSDWGTVVSLCKNDLDLKTMLDMARNERYDFDHVRSRVRLPFAVRLRVRDTRY